MTNRITVAELKIMVDGLEYRINRLEQLQMKPSMLSRITKRTYALVQCGITYLPKFRRIDGGLQVTIK